MKSRRISKKIILLSGFLALLLSFYLYFGLVPGEPLKNYATQKIEELTGNTFRFTKILYLPFQGLSFYDLRVADKTGRAIFSAKKMSVNARILPFFREKKIIISSVHLDSPVYNFELKPRRVLVKAPPPKTKISGQIEVPVVSEDPSPKISDIAAGPDAFLPENVYLEEIRINNGLVRVLEDLQSPVIEEIHSINVRMGFQKPPVLRFDGSLSLGPDAYAFISLKGNWDLDKAEYEFYLMTKSRQVPQWLLDYQKNHFLILRDGEIYIETYLKSVHESRALFHSRADLRNGRLSLNKTLYTGHMKLDAQGLFNFNTRSFDRYRGDLNFLDVGVDGLSKDIPRLDNIKGNVHFEPDVLDIQKLAGYYKKVNFEANGKIRSFKNLLLDLSIRSKSSIGEALSLIPKEQKKILSGFEIEGVCEAETLIRGSLRKTSELEKDYKLVFKEGSLKNIAKKIYLTNMSAHITMNRSGVNLKNCRFLIDKADYAINLFIPKDASKPGRLELQSGELKLIGTYLSKNGAVLIQQATALWSDATVKFTGMLSNLERPHLDIKGNSRFDLSRLPTGLVARAPALKDMGLRGSMGGAFILRGFWNDPLGWDLSLDGSGDPIYANINFRLDNAKFQLRMQSSVLKIPFLSARAYGGSLGGNLTFDLAKSGTAFEGKIYLNQMNLNLLINDLKLESNRELAGTMNAQAEVRGILKSQETYTGKGFIAVRNGHLWKTDLFKAMGRLPLVRVQGLDVVVFRDLAATFEIRDKKLWTQDMRLKSEAVDLALDGTIGFDQSLDLIMNIYYSNAVIEGAFDTGGLVPFVVQQAEDVISQYRISGTLKDPKYDKMAFPVGRAIGKKITGLVQTLTT